MYWLEISSFLLLWDYRYTKFAIFHPSFSCFCLHYSCNVFFVLLLYHGTIGLLYCTSKNTKSNSEFVFFSWWLSCTDLNILTCVSAEASSTIDLISTQFLVVVAKLYKGLHFWVFGHTFWRIQKSIESYRPLIYINANDFKTGSSHSWIELNNQWMGKRGVSKATLKSGGQKAKKFALLHRAKVESGYDQSILICMK